MAKKKSQNKLVKFIAAAAGIILVGSAVAWYAGVQKFKEFDVKAKELLEKEGFTLNRSEPSYSGFPFKITQNTESVEGTIEKNGSTITYSGKNIKASAWIFNPGHIETTGDISLSMKQADKDSVTVSFGKIGMDIGLNKDGKLIQKGLQIKDLSLYSAVAQKAIIKVQEISSEEDVKQKDENTELKGGVTFKKVEINTNPETPFIIDRVKVKGKIVSKFKSNEDLMAAFRELDEDLNKKINESCQSKEGRLPPVGDLVKELEDTKAGLSGEIEIKMGDFKLELEFAFKIKDGFPEIEAKLVLDDFDKMTQNMVKSGTLDASSEQMARLSLSAVADRDAKEGDYVIKASLKDRKLTLGKNTIREFKKIDWNHLPVPDDFCQKYQTAGDETGGLMLRGLSPYISYPVF